MHCTQCGTKADDTDKFCRSCGHALPPIEAFDPPEPAIDNGPEVMEREPIIDPDRPMERNQPEPLGKDGVMRLVDRSWAKGYLKTEPDTAVTPEPPKQSEPTNPSWGDDLASTPPAAPVVTPPTFSDELDSETHSLEPRPWRRFFARYVDVVLLGAPFAFLLAFMAILINPELAASPLINNEMIAGLMSLLLMIPLFAWILSAFGTTPGKALLGLRVVDKQTGRLLSFGRSVGREIHVWFAGMGMGLPLVYLFTHAFAIGRLNREGETSWDKSSAAIVISRKFTPLRTALTTLAVIVIFTGFSIGLVILESIGSNY